jgi:hypothetical protein
MATCSTRWAVVLLSTIEQCSLMWYRCQNSAYSHPAAKRPVLLAGRPCALLVLLLLSLSLACLQGLWCLHLSVSD